MVLESTIGSGFLWVEWGRFTQAPLQLAAESFRPDIVEYTLIFGGFVFVCYLLGCKDSS